MAGRKERNHGSIRSFSTSLFMRGITMERSHSSALSVARASHDQETWSTIRGSLKETTIEVHLIVWQELSHIRLRFMKGITLERSHSIAQSVARDFHYQETRSTIRRSWKETTIEVHQMWQELFHIRSRFMKGITLERSHSIAQRSTGSKHFEYHQKIHEGNHWSLRRFSTSRFMKGIICTQEKPFKSTKCGKIF